MPPHLYGAKNPVTQIVVVGSDTRPMKALPASASVRRMDAARLTSPPEDDTAPPPRRPGPTSPAA